MNKRFTYELIVGVIGLIAVFFSNCTRRSWFNYFQEILINIKLLDLSDL